MKLASKNESFMGWRKVQKETQERQQGGETQTERNETDNIGLKLASKNESGNKN